MSGFSLIAIEGGGSQAVLGGKHNLGRGAIPERLYEGREKQRWDGDGSQGKWRIATNEGSERCSLTCPQSTS